MGGIRGDSPPPPLEEDQTYQVSFLAVLKCLWGPVAGFQGRVTNRTNLRVHFMHHHVRDAIVTPEEGNRTYPR